MYLPTLVVCMLLTTSVRGLTNATAGENQQASVQEVSQPPMTVQNAAPQDYKLPGYYTFNKGAPFYVEKNPLTGAIDFSKKTTPSSTDNIESNTASGVEDEKSSLAETESDYFYDDQDLTGDGIDRKDGSIQGSNIYRPNEILQNPYKVSPDLHQFLNLPVHYSSSNKYPLISSSYANTKVQGTGSSSSNSYSNHKYVTSSTQSPSYYTMPTTRYTTQRPQYQTTPTRATTSRTTTTTTKSTSTTMEAEEEYENTDYNEYEGEDSGSFLDNQAVPSEHHVYKPETTLYTVTTYRPTTPFRFTTTTFPSTSVQPTTEKPTQQVSIVTSLPVDVYYSTSHEPINTTTTQQTTSPSTTTANLKPYEYNSTAQQRPTTESYNISQPLPVHVPNDESYYNQGGEPFRPIFGPTNTSTKHEGNNYIPQNNNDFIKSKPGDINDFHRLPPHPNLPPYIQRPTLPPQMEPPRPDAPQSFYPNQPVKLVPGQHTSINFGESSISTISRPIQDNMYERPHPPPSHNPAEYKPEFSHNRPDSYPVFDNRPSERPVQTVKPRPAGDQDKSNFKLPSKIDNHFIKVSPNQENPSYSLQTSFSIGVPVASEQDEKNQSVRPGQAVGQVFFPDNTPAENFHLKENEDLDIPSPVLRPPSSRVPIQSYQPNRGGYRQPIHVQARPPPFRLPNEDLQPPNGETDNYPRPHWETPNKPFHGPALNAIPKKDLVLPSYYPGLSRGKPEHIIHPADLPNILPQFRPNAKLGHVEYHQPFSSPGERVKEPVDTLQPPPLPQPQHLRINRNDDELEIETELISEETKGDPLVHRRSGPQQGRVTTLQMMQQNSQRKPTLYPELALDSIKSKDKDKPVFLVYPSGPEQEHRAPLDEAVVIGTRAQKPLPPTKLEKDEFNTFSLDDNKQFPLPGRDRVDTPILKTKLPNKPLVKNEFPYPIVKPFTNSIPEERILSSGSNVKEYTAFSPTPASSSTEENKDHDSEINLIPYLQDYMPFAMKKPQLPFKLQGGNKKDAEGSQKPGQVISATLNASLATTAKTTTEKAEQIKTESQEKSGSEMTVSATIYTQPKPSNHKVPVTYTPSEPQPLGFQAPFVASLSAPQSQGWSVVTDKNLQPATEAPNESTNTGGEENKFDIENFQPQLFGGFKPILPQVEEDVVGLKDKDKDVVLTKGDREERLFKL